MLPVQRHLSLAKELAQDAELFNRLHGYVKGKSDGRISVEDADDLLKFVLEKGYDERQKLLVSYARCALKWTPEADKHFKNGIRKVSLDKARAARATTA